MGGFSGWMVCAGADVYEETRERAYGREYLRHNVERERINNAASARCLHMHRAYVGEFMWKERERERATSRRLRSQLLIKVSTWPFAAADRAIIRRLSISRVTPSVS